MAFFIPMNLKQEVAPKLKPLAEIFDKLAYRHGNYSEVFSDFVNYTVACFLLDGDKKVAEHLKDKYKQDYALFNDLLMCFLDTMNKCLVSEKSWYDVLGEIYETISHNWKSSALGQFFTPPALVDCMTVMTLGDLMAGEQKRILDSACGSGRMLIAAHAHAPGNFQFGADIDPICTKMTAINMMVHGCVGEVSCMDSLRYDWRFGYQINPYLSKFGVPQIEHISIFERSIFYIKKEIIKPIPKQEFKPATAKTSVLDTGQLTLF